MEFIFDIDVIKALNIYLVAASSLIEKALFHCFKNSTFIKIKFLHVLGVVSGFISYLFICFVLFWYPLFLNHVVLIIVIL